jgi:uncharacterized protein
MDKPWYRRAFSHSPTPDLDTARAKADGGDPEAQFGLGLKYSSGPAGAEDYPQAALWYRKAADQSHALAQFNLAVMYSKGQGMPQDNAQALHWFGKAARQGDAAAQFHLGITHHRASFRGIPNEASESKIEAYKWFQLAAAQGYKGSATAGETMSLSMTREEVADGDRRAASWVAEKNICIPAAI